MSHALASGVAANLGLGERSEVHFPSPHLPFLPLPSLYLSPSLTLLSRPSSPPFRYHRKIELTTGCP